MTSTTDAGDERRWWRRRAAAASAARRADGRGAADAASSRDAAARASGPARDARRPRRGVSAVRRRPDDGHGGPALYPTPRTVSTTSGRSGSRSTFERSRCTWTLTSRVSAACR